MKRGAVVVAAVLVACAGSVDRGAPETPEAVAEVEPRVFGEVQFTPDELEQLLALRFEQEVPPSPTNHFADDPAAAEFGRRVFYDERFSGDGEVSCSTCHDPTLGFADGKGLADVGRGGKRHTPALWNVGHHRWFFWDGRSDSLWAQALSPLENEVENGFTRLEVAHLIATDAALRSEYEAVFGPVPPVQEADRFPAIGRPRLDDLEHPDHIVWMSMTREDRVAVTRMFVNVGKALAAFQRRIRSDDSPFDRFVEGVREANPRKQRDFSEAARRGFKLFVGKARCTLCHHGAMFTDFEFHNTRIPALEGGTSLDGGRFTGIDLLLASEFLGTSEWSDDPTGLADAKVSYIKRTGHSWGEFKTPSLRNVAVTAPYMHNGKFETLAQVVRFYSTLENAAAVHHGGERLLVPLDLTKAEQADLVRFLESLTDADVDPALRED